MKKVARRLPREREEPESEGVMGDEVEKHQCAPENVAKMLSWIRERGGVAIWRSANLSNPGASWSTPAWQAEDEDGVRKLAVSPTWQAEKVPSRVITDPSEIEVVTAREVKRFRVAVRRGSQGMMLKVTDAGTRRIREAVAKAGGGAWYEFDYESQEAVIYVPDKKVPLLEWAERSERELEVAHDGSEKVAGDVSDR